MFKLVYFVLLRLILRVKRIGLMFFLCLILINLKFYLNSPCLLDAGNVKKTVLDKCSLHLDKSSSDRWATNNGCITIDSTETSIHQRTSWIELSIKGGALSDRRSACSAKLASRGEESNFLVLSVFDSVIGCHVDIGC